MNTSYLLDSSVLIFSLHHDVQILQKLSEAASLFISTIALGELYYGAEHSSNVVGGRAEVDLLVQTLSVLKTDHITAKIYGYIKHEQPMKGQMLPDNDIWIAATAIQYGLTLAARDNHFTWIADLSLEQW